MSEEIETRPVASGSVIAVAIGVMNIATYGFTILAARLLKPQGYGAFAAVMNLLLVISVVSLALQATAARRISSTPGDVSVIEDGVRRLTSMSAAGLGLLLLLATPLIDLALHLHSVTTAALVGLTAIPLTVMGGMAGVLQGERRWRSLAWLYVAAGVPRVIVGVGLLAWRPNELIAVLSVFIGSLAPVVVGAWALRERLASLHHEKSDDDHSGRALTNETARNSMALLGFFALSNLDVIVARSVLDPHEAGLYAAGLILTKAVLFLPQFVVVLAFPAMSDAQSRQRTLRLSLLLVGALGVVGVLTTWVLSGVAQIFVGGHAYVDVQHRLWLFAVLGTLLSMIQLLVYALLARQGSHAVHLLWLGLLAIVVGARLATTVGQLVTVVVLVDAVMFLVLLLPALMPDKRPAEVDAIS